MNSALARATIVMVTALATAAAFNFYRTAEEKRLRYHAAWATQYIAAGPERFREVIAIVPTEAEVGYFSDLTTSSSKGELWFDGALYALAPRLVVPYGSLQRKDWILGNFSKPVDLLQIERENHLKLVRDFGSGVVLFRGDKW